MTTEMVADAAKAFRPKILYPYHYGKTKTAKIIDLLKDEKDIEVRIRRMMWPPEGVILKRVEPLMHKGAMLPVILFFAISFRMQHL